MKPDAVHSMRVFKVTGLVTVLTGFKIWKFYIILPDKFRNLLLFFAPRICINYKFPLIFVIFDCNYSVVLFLKKIIQWSLILYSGLNYLFIFNFSWFFMRSLMVLGIRKIILKSIDHSCAYYIIHHIPFLFLSLKRYQVLYNHSASQWMVELYIYIYNKQYEDLFK